MKISFKKSVRARRMRLTVKIGGSVVVTVPNGVGMEAAEQFVAQKAHWLKRAVARMEKVSPRIALPRSFYKQKRTEAERLIRGRLSELNLAYGFSYRAITVRNQKTRWGSCSRRGNLSFNYRLVLLPQQLVDYVLVHELCHLREFNHSRRFWELVGRSIPDHVIRRRQLRRYDLRLA